MNDRLKPCPFCGEDEIKVYRNGNSHYCYCSLCEASTKNFSVSTNEEKVIKYWNRRTTK